ncbi:peptide/nickel transport system substrate-binding protein [Bauldia litoralis]|uniref:Peptide/nickel transport system substrate-binding protein n=2 Tax=Bauldia litoralis TaxID=665467 RepID=A0A1G6EL78_9HYPH|nr:peptide/nickel transport system substrate-binding protein [Bauldia litoralis]
MKMKSVIGGLALAGFLALGPAMAGEGVLKIGRDQDSVFMDPILVSQNADVWVMNNINAQLVRNTREATGIEPDLAESWRISDDGKTYTFSLREGLTFSDGSPLKASDVKFSLERLRDGEESVFGSMFGVITDIQVPDDRTVVIELSEATTPFLSFLALFAAAILPEAAVTGDYDAFSQKPIGAGAFRLVDWRRGDRIILEENEHYWEADLPKLAGVEWIYVPNDNTRVLQLQAGEVDAMIFVPFNRIAELDSDPDINVHLDPSSRMDHVLINHSHEPFDDVRVRKALAKAIDLDSIIEAVTFGYGTPANSYIPAGGMFYNADNPSYEHNLEEAKALLAEAGVEDLTIEFVVQAGDANYEQVAVLLQSQLAEAGITVNITKQETGQVWDTIVEGDYDLSPNYWTNDVIDPDQKTGFVLDGSDEDVLSYYTRYNNPEVNALIAAARVETDEEKRKAMYYDLQRIAQEDVNWLGLYYSPFRNASRSNVGDFFQNPMGRFMLETTTKQ